jgi:hypothetical protein
MIYAPDAGSGSLDCSKAEQILTQSQCPADRQQLARTQQDDVTADMVKRNATCPLQIDYARYRQG